MRPKKSTYNASNIEWQFGKAQSKQGSVGSTEGRLSESLAYAGIELDQEEDLVIKMNESTINMHKL